MAYIDDIKNIQAELVTDGNGLLSKIQIGGKTYEIKDLIAREGVETVAGLVEALSEKVDVLEKSGYDDTEVRNLIAALQEADTTHAQHAEATYATKEALAVEAEAARAAEKANADEIARVDAALKLAVENDAEGIDSIKELATWVNTHGAAAEGMSEAITKNAEDIAAMDAAYKKADEDLDKRLDVIETALGDGDGSVSDQIADALEAAKGYTDSEIDKVEIELGKKANASELGTLASKNSIEASVAGEVIKGVKATGKSAGSISVELEESNIPGSGIAQYTPAGTVNGGKVTAAGDVSIQFTQTAKDATLSRGDYIPEGTVSVVPTSGTVKAVDQVGTAASFVEGNFTPASLDYAEVTANYATEGLVGAVDGETLTFSLAAIQALSASKVNNFTGGSKAADTFTPNVPTSSTDANVVVGITSAGFAGTKAENLKVTGVSYMCHDSATATFTGTEVDVTGASFTGTQSDINVTTNIKSYGVKTANFVPDDVELSVGDITIADKEVSVSVK